MNWTDIKRSLDSEINRLESERVYQLEQDERFAEFIIESDHDPDKWRDLEIDPDRFKSQLMLVPVSEPVNEPNLVKVVTGRTYGDRKQLVTVIKGSSVTEFQQNWKDKAEAN